MDLNVAYSELTRVLPWSIRALGYPFGTAERASTLVANAAAFRPSVLHDFVKTPRRSNNPFTVKRRQGSLEVIGDNSSFLEVGPVVIDYLAAHVSDESFVAANVVGARDKWLIDALLALGADYNMTILVVDCCTNLVEWRLAKPGTSGPVLWSGNGVDELIACFETEVGEKLARLIADCTPSGIAFVGTYHGVASDCVGTRCETFNRKLVQAYERGIPVNSETLNSIYKLEMVTWAPTSERSRAQAGFVEKSEPRT